MTGRELHHKLEALPMVLGIPIMIIAAIILAIIWIFSWGNFRNKISSLIEGGTL